MAIAKTHSWAYVAIWEFRVRPRMKKRFLAAYGPEGEWAKLFRQDKRYIGTQLIQDLKARRTYMTVDFWTSQAAYENFRRRHASEYEAIDARCESLTESEREVGSYVKVGKQIKKAQFGRC